MIIRTYIALLALGIGFNVSAQCENINGDFETYDGVITTSPNEEANEWINDDLNNWFVSHGSPTTGDDPSTNMWMWSYGSQGEGVYTEFTFIAGETYYLSYDLWRDPASSVLSEFRVELSNSLTPQYSASDDYPVTIGNEPLTTQEWINTGEWVTITETFTPADDYSQLWLHPFLTGPAIPAQGACTIDNVCITNLDKEPCEFEPIFTVSSGKGCNYLFNNTTEIPLGFEVLSTTWDFGDGNTTSGDYVQHYYTSTGIFEVCMTLWVINQDGECCQLSSCKTVTSFNCDPCDLMTSAGINTFGSPSITFAVNGIPPSAIGAFGYHWSFGDGQTGTGASIAHEYDVDGFYEVCLTIYFYKPRSGECCSFEICQTIEAEAGEGTRIKNESDTSTKNNRQQTQLNHSVVVYPNPSRGEFNIHLSDEGVIKDVKVMNQLGQLVYESIHTNSNATVKLDLSNLEKGTYFIVINETSDSPSNFCKVIIQ